jgi:homoserine dehydrogenase
MEDVTVGLVGLGTVGTGVAKILAEHGDRIARRAGKRVRWKWAAVRDPSRARGVSLDGVRVTNDPGEVVRDPEVSILVETMGGVDQAADVVLAALDAGKHVVTANKAMLAERGREIFDRARRAHRAVAFEASAGGGIPIVQALGVSLAANQVLNLAAILNGTCNYILTKMTLEGRSYAEALAQAQALGYAEADPTLDVDGTDTAHKLVILAELAFGTNVVTRDIPRRGIDQLDLADLKYAGELGYAVKLLAVARLSDDGLDLRVSPALVRQGNPLAEVRGPYNAVRVVGDAVGDAFFYGQGAGMMPTASAVVGDLIDVVTGRALITSRVLNLWGEPGRRLARTPSNKVRRRYYLRFIIADRPGVISALTQILGGRGISIASVIQHDTGDDAPANSPVPLVIMTHLAVESEVVAALEEIDRLDVTHAPSVRLAVED